MKMASHWPLAGAFLLGACVAVPPTILAAREYWHTPHLAIVARLLLIEEQIQQVEEPFVLLLGDSTAARFHLPTVCGLPVLNAGVGRATTAEVLEYSAGWLQQVEPTHIILSVGLNDPDPAVASARAERALGPDYVVEPSFGDRPDTKHLTADSYRELKKLIEADLCAGEAA